MKTSSIVCRSAAIALVAVATVIAPLAPSRASGSEQGTLKRIQVGGGPVGMVITPDGHRAFVARSQANRVSVVDLDEFKIAGDIEPGQQPDGLAFVR
jgi:DNA-binding beta-propeller fold protein YncE